MLQQVAVGAATAAAQDALVAVREDVHRSGWWRASVLRQAGHAASWFLEVLAAGSGAFAPVVLH